MYNFVSGIRRKLPRFIKLLGLVLVVAVSLICLVQTSTLASATGSQNWGGFTIDVKGVSFGIPAGTLGHQITGEGRRITDERAGFTTPTGSMCNWQIDFVYFDTKNVERGRRIGPEINKCDRNADRRETGDITVPYGKACAALYRSGQFITRQCHFITK